MRASNSPKAPSRQFSLNCAVGFALLVQFTAVSRGDQVEMQNGDRYLGTVLALNAETLTLRSEVLGTITVPRGQISRISLGASNTATPTAAASTNTGAVTADTPLARLPALGKLPADTNGLQQVQEQLLADATPEARSKFRELALGYMTGKVTVNDIRAEARTAVEQLKTLKAELGEEAGGSFDSYLSILESFLNDTKPLEASPPATNATPRPMAKPASP